MAIYLHITQNWHFLAWFSVKFEETCLPLRSLPPVKDISPNITIASSALSSLTGWICTTHININGNSMYASLGENTP